jgi:drug/metabolite transporter (DMT)-like permease
MPGLTSLPWSVPEPWRAHAALAVGNALLGLGGVLTERHPVADPLALVLAREGHAALVLLALFVRRGAPRRRHLLAGALLAGTNVLYVRAVRADGAALVTVWQSALPLLTGALAAAVGDEEGAAVSVPGLLLATAGCLVASSAAAVPFDATLLLQTACCAAFFVVTKRHAAADLAWSYAAAATCVAALVAARGRAPRVGDDPRAFALLVAYWVACGSVGAYLLLTWANRRVPTPLVGAYFAVQPLVAFASAPSPRLWLGAGLVFAGLALAAAAPPRAAPLV